MVNCMIPKKKSTEKIYEINNGGFFLTYRPFRLERDSRRNHMQSKWKIYYPDCRLSVTESAVQLWTIRIETDIILLQCIERWVAIIKSEFRVPPPEFKIHKIMSFQHITKWHDDCSCKSSLTMQVKWIKEVGNSAAEYREKEIDDVPFDDLGCKTGFQR